MLERWFEHIKDEPMIFGISCIGLYSGMRLDEICSLKKEDVVDDCFRVTEGKTKSSIRTVPIHNIILPMVEKLIGTSNNEFLLSDLRNRGNDRSHYVGKLMTTRRKQLGFEKRKYTFHSFRSNFMTEMDNNETDISIIETLVGHSHKNLVRDVYSSGVRMERLRNAINQLSYRKVDNTVQTMIST